MREGGRRASSLCWSVGVPPPPPQSWRSWLGVDRSINLIRFLKEMGWAVRIQRPVKLRVLGWHFTENINCGARTVWGSRTVGTG